MKPLHTPFAVDRITTGTRPARAASPITGVTAATAFGDSPGAPAGGDAATKGTRPPARQQNGRRPVALTGCGILTFRP